MNLRLTDLDQDDVTPIEMMRDPIGVLLIDDKGWSAVSVKAGVSETGTGTPSDLAGGMSWVTNCAYETMRAVSMAIGRSDVRLKTSDWFKPDLAEMLDDWGADRYPRTQRAEFLARLTDRVMRLSFETIRAHGATSAAREQAVLSQIERSASLATGFRTTLATQMEKGAPTDRKVVAATVGAMKFGAFAPEEASVSDGEVLMRLRPPRLSYAEMVLSKRVPAAGKWQQAHLESKDLITDQMLSALKALDRPVLISARIVPIRGAEDPILATWTTPSGPGYVRKAFPLEEVEVLFGSYRFHDPLVMVGPAWKEPAGKGLLDALVSACGAAELAHASWSAGVVAENVLCGMMRLGRAPKGGNEGVTVPESVWIGAHDRIAMLPMIRALSGFGLTLVGGYAGGVRFKAPEDPEMISSAANAAWELGMHAQMGLARRIREMGSSLNADRGLYGGAPERILLPLLMQTGRTGQLWKIDEIIETDPEGRPAAFLALFS
ncbi:hypothetical protein IQ03_01244 [Gemmobacter caeni]|uniref:Uncharacterized protein n=1 Tax=Gemmobacter caeni TaxID=589035 RepID=A0A2T6B8X8_9RHOB|nr:hypothetical protein [Gemmobacter caeni]PTX52503.1 hypothetical protein C8N34_102283 [Gemmobacter caeni]TWJ02826.1 hypothetical protein IQ03_01244 [Gemmobacter caeni]